MKLEDESHIVWLRRKENYAYLREGIMSCGQRVRFPLKPRDPAQKTDGGEKAHIVAYAVLRPNAESSFLRGNFERRYWWVKGYDRWDGHGDHNGHWYDAGAPCEAIEVESVRTGVKSESYRGT